MFTPRLMPLVAAAFFLSGCAVGGPRVDVHHSVMGEVGEEATIVNIEMDLHNPRNHPLELRELHYRVSIAGRRVYEGRRATAMTLRPRETARVDVPAVLTVEDADALVLALAQGLRVSGEVEFVSPGRLSLVMRDLGLPRPRAAFRGASDLDLQPN